MSALQNAAPASSCMRCHREGIFSPDQNAIGAGGSRLVDTGLSFYCACGHEWRVHRPDAELHGRFLDRAGLRERATPAEASAAVPPVCGDPEPTGRTMRAVLDALADEVQAKTAKPAATAQEELSAISARLAGELNASERRSLMQRWAELTLMIGAS